MNRDDYIYICLFTICFRFGSTYNAIKDKNKRKCLGTGVGLLIALFIAGSQAWQCLLMCAGNAVIILWLSRRCCHVISFAFTFSFLFLIRTAPFIGEPFLPFHTKVMHMMLALKLVGLSLEVSNQRMTDTNDNLPPNFFDVFHYSFSYLGILTGPYYRYKTFSDSFNLPFAAEAPRAGQMVKNMSSLLAFVVLLEVSEYIWPVSYALTEEFYNERSWLYRLWYCWPLFFSFRMRFYAGTLLSECLYVQTGLGAYPSVTESKPGLGPSANFANLKQMADDWTSLNSAQCDFRTIQNNKPYEIDFCLTVRDGMKNWNMCTQYWLVSNVYKRFPIRALRTCTTMIVSAFWHGIELGYYVCLCTVVFYLPVEDMYVKMLIDNNKGGRVKAWKWIIWLSKMQTFSYLSVAFHLLYTKEVVKYYGSTYCCVFIAWAVLYIIGLAITYKRAE